MCVSELYNVIQCYNVIYTPDLRLKVRSLGIDPNQTQILLINVDYRVLCLKINADIDK